MKNYKGNISPQFCIYLASKQATKQLFKVLLHEVFKFKEKEEV